MNGFGDMNDPGWTGYDQRPDATLTSAGLIRERADWLVDAVATATQNRALLRGDDAEDAVLTEALYLNAIKAMETLLARSGLEADQRLVAVAPEWLDIASAPLSGPAFLVWCPDRHNVYLVIRHNGNLEHFAPGGDPLRETATHWMPLPSANGPTTGRAD